MTGSKYELYGRPVAPTDPNADYMSVQETAFVMDCSVDTVRRLLKQLDLGSKPGRSIRVSREDRAALYEARRFGSKPRRATRAPRQRQHSARIPAQRTAPAA